jgi:hypothetical protein
VNEQKARAILAERSEGVCEVCSSARATNAHHRRGLGQGGTWTPSNLLHVCGTGTTGCHGHITTHPAVSREQGWSVPSWRDPAGVPVWLARHGWVLLTDTGSIEDLEAA